MATQGLSGLGDASTVLVKRVSEYNPFDTTASTFTRLLNDKQYTEAEKHFNEKYEAYFATLETPTPDMERLAVHLLTTRYAGRLDRSVTALGAINDLTDPSTWAASREVIKTGQTLNEQLRSEPVMPKTVSGRAGLEKLAKALDRVSLLVTHSRSDAMLATAAEVIRTGQIPEGFPDQIFTEDDYRLSPGFQKLVMETLSAEMPEAERDATLSRIQGLLAEDTAKKLVEGPKIKRIREAILADGRIDLSELPRVRELVKTYGEASGLTNAVNIGYVDLTATSFRDRNVFDFEIAFTPDYGIQLNDAKDALLNGDLAAYDFVFVTDLSAAKIFREFKNKQEFTSEHQTGTRQEPNPAYVQAATNYQQAMANMNQLTMENAIQGSRPCYGNAFACALGGVLRGVAEAGSRDKVQEASSLLANTSQTITKPVFSPYNYHTVDISAAKVARVDYFVIDTKQKAVHQSDFEIKDHENFTVSYNVEDTDPRKSSILSNSQREEDVTAWEKKPVSIKLSDLFSEANLSSASKKRFVSAEAFLKPLSNRKYASVKPIYSERGETRTAMTESVSPRAASASRDSSTIADERFDSVVIVKNAGSIGTGFYVTPDIVMTAYHVVEKAKLVEMTFYDGTKTYGKVIDHDVRLDLALVKAQTAGKPVKIHSGPIKLGETVEAIGHPKGYEFTITRGVISAMRKQSGAALKASAPVEFVQTDTPISPGNSGGPLFLKDAVVGVNDWVRVDKASQNLNFSVSFNEIRSYLSRFEGM